MVSSLWNIGECLGVFDMQEQRGDLNRGEFEEIFEKFFSETVDLAERGDFELSPISGRILDGSWSVILGEPHLPSGCFTT